MKKNKGKKKVKNGYEVKILNAKSKPKNSGKKSSTV